MMLDTEFNTTVAVVIPASGIGSRMAADRPKQYLPLSGQAILAHTVARFIDLPWVSCIVIALAEHDRYFAELALTHPKIQTVVGGETRADSVSNALAILPAETWVMVHDAARPLLCRDDIERLYHAVLHANQPGILAFPAKDTLKLADASRGVTPVVTQTVDRAVIWHALTPQMAKVGELRHAIHDATAAGVAVTDEASALEWAGASVLLVKGRESNLKITQPEDLALAEYWLAHLPLQ